MRALWRRLGDAWTAVRDVRYRSRMRRDAIDGQRFQDRQARHDAGIFEPPRGGSI